MQFTILLVAYLELLYTDMFVHNASGVSLPQRTMIPLRRRSMTARSLAAR
jgi:hypothetical protein